MTPPNEAPKPVADRLVRVAHHYQDGRDWRPGAVTLAEARRNGAVNQSAGCLGVNVEIYDAATGAWLETWYMDGSVRRA